MKPALLSDEARADALDAHAFYEGRRKGLGVRFRDHLDRAILSIRQDPPRSPVVYRELRRKLVVRFPYAVYYRVYDEFVYIVAVMHGRRNPEHWKRRASGG